MKIVLPFFMGNYFAYADTFLFLERFYSPISSYIVVQVPATYICSREEAGSDPRSRDRSR